MKLETKDDWIGLLKLGEETIGISKCWMNCTLTEDYLMTGKIILRYGLNTNMF